MRKRERKIIEGALNGAAVFIILDGLNQYVELRQNGKPILENLNVESLAKSALIGFSIGGVAGFLLYKVQQWEDKELLFCPDNHLHNILNLHNVRNDPSFNEIAKNIVCNIKDKISMEFGDDLIIKPLDFGSRKTKTAIGGSSDFDILITFRKGINSLTQKGDEVLDFIKQEFRKNQFKVRQQRHSIGLECIIGSKSLQIDIVAAKERNSIQKTGEITIVRRAMNFWETNTYIKSNIWVKRNLLVNQPVTRKLLKLMKLYRDGLGMNFKSPVIEILVKEAVDRNNGYINTSIYNNFTFVMGYIADQLSKRSLIIDAANSNNNLLSDTSKIKRKRISSLLISDLEKLAETSNFLKEMFEMKE